MEHMAYTNNWWLQLHDVTEAWHFQIQPAPEESPQQEGLLQGFWTTKKQESLIKAYYLSIINNKRIIVLIII